MPPGAEEKLADGTVRKNVHRWESIHTSLLMDIRDELKELNRKLANPGHNRARLRLVRGAPTRLDRIAGKVRQ